MPVTLVLSKKSLPAYNTKGKYVGNQELADNLKLRGIEPELARENDWVCRVGFCENRGSWYGWSGKLLQEFRKGDTVRFTDGTEKTAKTLPEARELAVMFAESCDSMYL